jgi:hypothetical protein
MLITSLGIFGYLSAAYQKSSIEFGITQEKIVNVETQKEFYLTKIDDSKKRITELTKLRVGQEERMSGILTNEMITRNPIQLKQLQEQTISLINSTDSSITEENTKIQKSNDEIQTLNDEINSLKLLTAEKKDVQTFKFVADALGISLDTVARWFILGIIFVFDPLAICLVLAYNVSVYKKVDDSVYEEPPSTKPTINKTVETPVVDIPTIEVEEPIVENSPIEEPPTTQETTPTVVSQPTQVVEPVKDEFYNQYFKHST